MKYRVKIISVETNKGPCLRVQVAIPDEPFTGGSAPVVRVAGTYMAYVTPGGHGKPVFSGETWVEVARGLMPQRPRG